MIGHDSWVDRLSEYVDDELAPSDRLQLEQHLLDCASCRETIDELRGVAAEASTLPLRSDTPPARDLWPGIASALPQPAPARWRVSLSLPQALAAGVLLMLVSGLGVWTYLGREMQGAANAQATAAADETVRPVTVSLEDRRYDRAVADLTKLLDAQRSRLDPKTAQVLERNLATIDRALAEAMAALAKDPSDPFLSSHVAEQRRLKLSVLRQAKNLVLASSKSE
jgi:anti-sigma factor RsiW